MLLHAILSDVDGPSPAREGSGHCAHAVRRVTQRLLILPPLLEPRRQWGFVGPGPVLVRVPPQRGYLLLEKSVSQCGPALHPGPPFHFFSIP